MSSQRIRNAVRKLKKAGRMVLTHPRGLGDFCLSTFSALARSEKGLGKPVFLSIEPTSACDLGCPVCETGAKVIGRPVGHMTLDRFKSVIDQVKHHTNAIQLYFMGESFLNRHIYDMVKHAKEQGITFVNIYSNGSVLDAERAVECGLDEVNFNIGGMRQETHEIYRINSKLDRVKANILALVEARKEAPKKSRPQINVGLIVMKQNEHEAEEFLKVVPTWGVDKAHIVDPCVRNMAQAISMLPKNRKYWFYDERAFEQGVLRPKIIPNNRCDWIYFSSIITWNGDVVPCCRDATGKHVMGNVFQQDFGQIWNGEKYREFRRQIRTNQNGMDICALCSGFQVPALYHPQSPSNEKSDFPLVV